MIFGVCVYISYIMTLSENVPYTLIWKSWIFMGLPYSQEATIISSERQLWQLFYTVLTPSPFLVLDTTLFSSHIFSFFFPSSLFLFLLFFFLDQCFFFFFFFIHLPKWTQLRKEFQYIIPFSIPGSYFIIWLYRT